MSNVEDIYLSNGASEAVRLSLSALLRNDHDGVLVPIPQYPLYSAQLTLMNGQLLPYHLNEEKNWALDADNLAFIIESAKESGIVPRAMVVINPGNPTGQLMKRENIESIISVCHENEILIMADEVYQSNVYKKGAEFVSFRKVLAEMGAPYNNETELISMHSVSKGLMGECGLRGGYMETKNLSRKASEMLYKLKSIELCSNTPGQLAVHLMVNPPTKGVESDHCVEQYLNEKATTQDGLKKRALLLTECFNSMKQVSCTDIEGAMYAFP